MTPEEVAKLEEENELLRNEISELAIKKKKLTVVENGNNKVSTISVTASTWNLSP